MLAECLIGLQVAAGSVTTPRLMRATLVANLFLALVVLFVASRPQSRPVVPPVSVALQASLD